MCGRYLLTSMPEAIRRLFAYPETPNFPARHNIAPTQPIPIVTARHGSRHFLLVRWGFIPAFTKDVKALPLMCNARAETVVDKPAFRNAMRHRRCLVPADGFYEWKRTPDGKQPYLLRPRHGGAIAFAGIHETYAAPDGSEIDTAAILTTAAPPSLAWLHERVPVVIGPDDFAAWLDTDGRRPADVAGLLAARDGLFEAVPVSTRVNSAHNDDASLVEPVPEAEPVEREPAGQLGLW